MHQLYNSASSPPKSQSLQFVSAILQQIYAKWYRLILPLLVVVALTFAAASGFLAFKLEQRFVEAAIAGIALFVLMLWGVEFVILTLLMITGILFHFDSLPYLFGFSSAELMVIFLLVLVIVDRLSSEEGFMCTPLDRPIFLFVGATIISFLNAKYNLGTVSMFRNFVMKTMLLYLLFFVITNLIRTRRQLMRLVGGMLIVATVIAGLMVVQQALGSTVSILPNREKLSNATALGQELVGVARLPSSGGVMICVMLFPTLLLYVISAYIQKHKWLLYIPLLLFPLAIAFTFDRNLWVGVAIASALLVFIVRAEGSRIILLVAIFLIGGILLGSLLNAYIPRIGTVFDALMLRFMSLFAEDELVYDNSTQWRLLENEYAMLSIRKHPLLGIGPGAAYRPYVEALGGDSMDYYIHNAYLWLLVDFGVVGFLPFLWFLILFLVRGISAWYKLKDQILRSLALGFTMGYVVVLVSSVAAPRLMGTYGAVLVAVIFGVNEVAIRLGHSLET